MKCVSCGKKGADYKISYKKQDGSKVKKYFHWLCLGSYPQFIENVEEVK